MVITVFANPVVDFSADEPLPCEIPYDIEFTPDSDPNYVDWEWTFTRYALDANNDNVAVVYQTSNFEIPIINYTIADTFDVKLKITDINGCFTTFTKDDYVNIVLPKANFDIDKIKGCKALDVKFTDLSFSREPITDWNWKFGTGDVATGNVGIEYQYADTGSYTVELEIINDKGCSSIEIKADTIVVGDTLTANFSQEKAFVCYNQTIQFNDLTTYMSGANVADEWKWTFCDTGVDTQQDPIYKFNIDTGYCSTEFIVGFHGCYDTLKVDSNIYVFPPKAEFTILKDIFCEVDTPYTAIFTDASVNAEQWAWRYGDGSGDSLLNANPQHTFINPGNYEIELVAINNTHNCRDSIKHSIYISEMTPNFTANITEGCAPLTSIFTSTSTGNQGISGFKWTYSDGFIDKDTVQVTHDFQNTDTVSLFYDVKLVVTDSKGCKDSLTKASYIDVNPNPIIDFLCIDTTGCVPFLANFTDISTPESPITKWNWVFGTTNITSLDKDTSFSFSPKGKYAVTLNAEDSKGCKGTLTKPDYIVATMPTANFTVPAVVCDSVITTLTSTSDSTYVGDKLTYKWDFGDLSTIFTSDSKNASHMYPSKDESSKTYTTKLTVTDLNLCESSISKDVIISVIKADFTTSPTSKNCPQLTVKFHDSSTTNPGTVSNLFWSFGDGKTSTALDSASNTYIHTGTYDAYLIATNNYACKDTLAINDLVTIGGPLGDFTFDYDYSECAPKVNFNAHTSPLNTVQWIFKDGKADLSSNDTTVTHQYLTPGTYYPVLIMKDPNGCKDSYENPTAVLIDFPIITLTLNPLTSATCLDNGGSAEFVSATGGTSPYTYKWEDETTGTWADGESPVAKTGLYGGTFEITVTDDVGCPGWDSVMINTIQKTVSITMNGTEAICEEENGMAFAVASDGVEPYSYQWSLEGSSAIIGTNDTIGNLAPSNVSLTVTDNIGCEGTKIHSIGHAFANILDNFSLQNAMCDLNNGFIILSPSGGYPPYSYKWLGSTINDSARHNLAPNNYYVTIIDDYGCELESGPYTIGLDENNSIHANFGFTPDDVIASIPINFSDSSTNDYPIVNWKWYVDDEEILDDTIADFSHLFPEGGIYDVKLLITDEFGCTDDTTKVVTIKSGLKNANVFTPNGDGKNDVFTIVSSGIQEFSIEIYNRWGVLIFAETSQYINWTGKTTAGVDVPAGTYYYILKAKGKDGEVYEGDDYKGFITLLR